MQESRFWINLGTNTGGGSGIGPHHFKNIYPAKMTKNDISCYFESFLGVEIFRIREANVVSAPCMHVALWVKTNFLDFSSEEL